MNLYPVTDSAWEKSMQEDSICFSGSPAETGNYGRQLASFALQPGGNQIEIDLTDFISEKMYETQLMTLYIAPATSATDNNYIHAKENETNPPMLILEY